MVQGPYGSYVSVSAGEVGLTGQEGTLLVTARGCLKLVSYFILHTGVRREQAVSLTGGRLTTKLVYRGVFSPVRAAYSLSLFSTSRYHLVRAVMRDVVGGVSKNRNGS